MLDDDATLVAVQAIQVQAVLGPDDEHSTRIMRLVRHIACVPEVDDQVAMRLGWPKTGKMDLDEHDDRLIDRGNSCLSFTWQCNHVPGTGQPKGCLSEMQQLVVIPLAEFRGKEEEPYCSRGLNGTPQHSEQRQAQPRGGS